jgi:dephospho-CoA kinase
MLIIGLTGSIGMGKTAAARWFREAGVAVHDADASVHALYEGAALSAIAAAFPAVIRDGAVDRALLARQVLDDPVALARLEAIVHPLVVESRKDFVRQSRQAGRHLIVLDIPLLFETDADRHVDVVLVVTANQTMQRARVMARPGMTEEKFAVVLARQMPDAEKRRRAHFIVRTDRNFAAMWRQLADTLRALAARSAV